MKKKFITQSLIKLSNLFIHRHSLKAEPSRIRCSPFFILGSGRNGSTLLSMILNNHSQIFIPPEQYALHYASMRYQLYNFLIWRDIVKIVIGEFADARNNEGWDVSFNDLYSRLYQLPKEERSFQKIVDEIIVEVARQTGQEFTIWGDKSPNTIWFINQIFRTYPKSKYIFLIRDGRDVVSSYNRGGEAIFGELSDIKNAARNWKECIQHWKWLKRRAKKDQLLEVRYEDLVRDPDRTIRGVLTFLECRYEDGMLEIGEILAKRKLLEKMHHERLGNPINCSSVGRWKRDLTKIEISLIEQLISKDLVDQGYLK